MKFLTKEIKIAIVAICGLIILFFGLNFLKGLNLFSNTNTYFISFKDISGLASSSPIYADGYKVGVVKGIKYDYNRLGDIRVEADIDPELRIPKGSSAEIVSDMLGNVKINLLLATNPRERVNPGEIIQGDINDGALGKMKDMVPVIMSILPKLDSISHSLNIILADPALVQSLHNIEATTGNLTESTKQLNTLLASLNKEVPGMMKGAKNVIDNTTTLTDNLNKIDLAGTMSKVDATLTNVETFTAKLNSNEGTIGLLMRDPSLYYNLNSTMRSADSLLIDLKAHPKRYVHFSLFGRKDK
ncbi:MAG: MlaD family protein [Prevotellaceae bacterium]|nr:MlaD family protein [Prevotellaceae bacterium]